MSVRQVRSMLQLALVLGTVTLSIGPVQPQGLLGIYFNDFESTVGPEWSATGGSTLIATTPSVHRFLGRDPLWGFSNETVRLSLTGLPAHTRVMVSFDLYVILTWDGNFYPSWVGPDIWDLSVDGGPTLLHTTFNNWVTDPFPSNRGYGQAYPGAYPGGSYPSRTGALEHNMLGYFADGIPMDTVYRLSFTFPHTADSVALNFSASGLQSMGDESWGLDNVRVAVDYVPVTDYVATVLADNPVAYWRLGESAGPTAFDSSGNNRHLAYNGFPISYLGRPGAIIGDPDTALFFDGGHGETGQVLTGPTNLVGATEFTIEAWVKLEPSFNTGPYHRHIFEEFSRAAGYHEWMHTFLITVDPSNPDNAGRLHYTNRSSQGPSYAPIGVTSQQKLSVGEWHHVAVTVGAEDSVYGARLYVDGQLDAVYVGGNWTIANPWGENPVYPSQTLVGAFTHIWDGRNFTQGFFLGTMDEVAIYRTNLSAARIQAHYQAGKGVDNSPPFADAGADQTVEQTSRDGAEVTLDAIGSSDPDNDPLTFTWKEGETVIAGPTQERQVQATLQLGTHNITLTVDDGREGTDADETVVVVRDTTPPTLGLSADVTVEQRSRDGTPVSLTNPSVSDNCDASPRVSSDAPAVFPLGTTTVIWTATDASGNSATVRQTVTVVDATPPQIAAPANITTEQANRDGTSVSLGSATVSDICDASPRVSNDAPAVFPLGTTTVTWTATDASGNTATATQTVTVVDTTPPQMTVPANITAEQTSRDGTAVNFPTPTVTDNCDANPTVSNNAPAVFPLGTTVVTWTATDASGNTATVMQTVTVVDTTAPTVNAGPNLEFIEGETVTLPTPTVSDICDASPQVSDNRPPTFPVGQTTVTFTATDDSGNVGTDSVVVTVKSAQGAIGELVTVVNGLPLTNAEKNSLNAKLDAAIESLDKGQETAAVNQLKAFINQVEALERSGRLDAAATAALIARAQRIIAAIQG